MKRRQSFLLLGLMLVVLGSCSRKKDTFVTRNFHAVTAEFNALYNGGEALIDGNEELTTNYRDNFWEVLPVERFEIKEAILKPGEKGNPNFNRAEEKAAKAIQKHSIYLNGKEYNPQIDEAYMMLGKARYYGQRFIPAIDAFNFILNRYPSSNSINEARMWKAKSSIQLGNEEFAIKELMELFGKEGLTDQDKADAAAILAQAYINLDSLPAALPMIKLAASMIKDKELQGRYRFIEGQIQNRLSQADSANLAFQKVIDLKRNTSRTYYVRSFLEQIKNFNYAQGDTVALKELLWDLGQDRENRPFRDVIFHETGNVYRIMKNIDTAVAYYNKSIKFYNEDRQLQANNYGTLADINFDLAEYQKAGKYYDSTLTFLEENSRTWRRMKKRRENLSDVIKYERIAGVNDSILGLVAMSPEEQLAYFTAYTEKLIAAAKADSIATAKREKREQNNEFYTKKAGKNSSGATFYFYNSTTVAYGKQEFRSIWGKRGLEDNWRNASKGTITPGADEMAAEEEGIAIERRTIMDPNTYIGRIPTDSLVIDSLKRTRNFAYYQLGLVYKEKFREYTRAADKLEKLLTFHPQERLVLPSKYYLYKIYEVLNNKQVADSWKMDIINNHPESRYAEILRNPQAQLVSDASSPEFKYKALYKQFEDGDYHEVLAQCEEYINLYAGNDILPKFELLKATALMYVEGFLAYKNAINFVALTYPQSDEGKQAQEIYTSVLPGLASSEFTAEGDKYKIVYRFDAVQIEAAQEYLETVKSALANFPREKLEASQDYYSPNELFVVIHGLKSPLGAKGFAETLAAERSYEMNRPYFVISSENYRVVQWHKNLIDYLDLQSVEVSPSGQ
ncbi:tetratricopeptide repeat protein [Flavobacteriaceae bacterium]|nr:tetratricopeptide repeat protein [Flavobacteriaceae bacterium]